MHFAFIGQAKKVLRTMKNNMTDNQKEIVYQRLARCTVPSDTTRVPNKFLNHIGNMQAVQLMSLFVNYAHVLFDDKTVQSRIVKYLEHFVAACRISIQQSISHDEIGQYNHHMWQFAQQFISMHGQNYIVPNFHMALHFPVTLHDFGSAPNFWCYTWERRGLPETLNVKTY